MRCCANCFNDRGLRNDIIPSRSTEVGKCNYCLTENVVIIEPEQLAGEFGALISIYEPVDDGLSLIEWLRMDWCLFDHPVMDDFRAKDLLSTILSNGEIVRKKFRPLPKYESEHLQVWERLRTELMCNNRYFPSHQINTERLHELLNYLTSDPVPTVWFRARIQDNNRNFTAEEMGAPPARVASHGRANPAGIPYLYVGSTEITSIAEVRPHTGERVSVAEFSLPPDLRLIDLRNPRRFISPFVGDEDWIGRMRCDIAFLEKLGQELTRPVLPRSAAIDYVPSQYLCEFIKKCGFDGVLYSSSVGDGINLALFNPEIAKSVGVREHSIKRVIVEIN